MFSDRPLAHGPRSAADVYGVDELLWDSPKVDATLCRECERRGPDGAHERQTKYLLGRLSHRRRLCNAATNRLSIVGGTSVEYNTRDLNYIRGEGFPSGFTTYIHNAANITTWDGSATDNNLVSFFTRANWSLSTAISSAREPARRRLVALRQRERYGIFPAVSLGWVVTRRAAFAQLARALRDDQAARQLRRDRQPGHRRLREPEPRARARRTAARPASAGSQLGNPNLKWETTQRDRHRRRHLACSTAASASSPTGTTARRGPAGAASRSRRRAASRRSGTTSAASATAASISGCTR